MVALNSQGRRPALECELWPRLYHLVLEVGRQFRRPGVRYSDAVVILVLLWGCLHDRPRIWACDARNWKSTHLRPLQIPSDSTISRRLQSEEVMAFVQAIEDRLRSAKDFSLLKILDGKPLLVGNYSKDPEARSGWGLRGLARGYKLHVICSQGVFPDAWEVR